MVLTCCSSIGPSGSAVLFRFVCSAEPRSTASSLPARFVLVLISGCLNALPSDGDLVSDSAGLTAFPFLNVTVLGIPTVCGSVFLLNLIVFCVLIVSFFLSFCSPWAGASS